MTIAQVLLNDFKHQWADTQEFVLQSIRRVGERGWSIADASMDRLDLPAFQEVSLPIHPYLTDAEVDRVVAVVNAWPAA